MRHKRQMGNRSDRNFRATRTSRKNKEQTEKRELHPVEAQTKIRSRSQVMLLNLGGAGFSIRRDTSVTQKGRGLTAGEGGFHKENYNGTPIREDLWFCTVCFAPLSCECHPNSSLCLQLTENAKTVLPIAVYWPCDEEGHDTAAFFRAFAHHTHERRLASSLPA